MEFIADTVERLGEAEEAARKEKREAKKGMDNQSKQYIGNKSFMSHSSSSSSNGYRRPSVPDNLKSDVIIVPELPLQESGLLNRSTVHEDERKRNKNRCSKCSTRSTMSSTGSGTTSSGEVRYRAKARGSDQSFPGVAEHIVQCNHDRTTYHLKRRKRRYAQERVKVTESLSTTIESPSLSPNRQGSTIMIKSKQPLSSPLPSDRTVSQRSLSRTTSDSPLAVIAIYSPISDRVETQQERAMSLQASTISSSTSTTTTTHINDVSENTSTRKSSTTYDSVEKPIPHLIEIKHPTPTVVCKKRRKVKVKKKKMINSVDDEKIIFTPPKEVFVSTSAWDMDAEDKHHRLNEQYQKHNNPRNSGSSSANQYANNNNNNLVHEVHIEEGLDMRFCLRQCLYYGGANP